MLLQLLRFSSTILNQLVLFTFPKCDNKNAVIKVILTFENLMFHNLVNVVDFHYVSSNVKEVAQINLATLPDLLID